LNGLAWSGFSHVLVKRFATDTEFTGQFRILLASRDAPFQLSDLLTVQKFLSVLSASVGALHARLASEILSRRR